MAFSGYERDDQTLKYSRAVKAWWISFPGHNQCPHYRLSIQVPLHLSRRIFTTIARSSYIWQLEYCYGPRESVVKSRLDVSFGWQKHFIRGINKIYVHMGR